MNAQPKMREGVLERRQLGRFSFDETSFWKTEQPTPEAVRRSPLEQHFAFVHMHVPRRFSLRQRFSRPRRRQLVDAAGLSRRAARLHGTRGATRGPGADRRTEVHQRLSVGFDTLPREQALGERPEVPGSRKVARQHALHVAIQDRGALAKREYRDRRGRRAAHPGELLNSRGGSGEPG
jgi:hypothetical protein